MLLCVFCETVQAISNFLVPTVATRTRVTANHGSTTQVTAVETATEHVHVTTTEKSVDHEITNLVSTKPTTNVTTNEGSTEFVSLFFYALTN